MTRSPVLDKEFIGAFPQHRCEAGARSYSFGCGVGCVGCVWLYWLLFCARNAAQATGEELPNFRLDRNILVYVFPCRLIRE